MPKKQAKEEAIPSLWTWEQDTGNSVAIRKDGEERMTIVNPADETTEEDRELAAKVCDLLNRDAAGKPDEEKVRYPVRDKFVSNH